MRARLALTTLILAAIAVLPSSAASADPTPPFQGPAAGYIGDIPIVGPLLSTVACPLFINGQIGTGNANPVTKTVRRFDKPDGSTDLEVTLTGPIMSTTIDAFDCVWVDGDSNSNLNTPETARPYRALGVPVSGTSPNRVAKFQLNVPGGAGKAICDRAAGANFTVLTANAGNPSGLIGGSWLVVYSGKVCIPPVPDPVVPESPLVPALLASGAGVAAIGYLWLRRSRLAAAA